MDSPTALSRHATIIVALLGMLFAACVYPLWALQGRWFAIALIALFLVALALANISHLGDFILIAFLFSIPLAGFNKWLFLDEFPETIRNAAPVGGALGIGLTDFLIAGLYLTWFVRVCITYQQPAPRFEGIDVLVLFLVFANIGSAWGAPNTKLALCSLAHLLKHVLAYFYLSKNLAQRHWPWFLAAIGFAIALEGSLAIFQSQTGMLLGLILDKGKLGEELNAQYVVPGIEEVNRATGTSYDSHTLGLYLAMLMPFALVFVASSLRGHGRRLLWGGLLLLGALGVAFSYSRSAWISAAAGLAATAVIMSLLWQQRMMVAAILTTVWAGVLASPWLLSGVFERLWTAPAENLTARFDQWRVAARIWLAHPLFGHGAGNYMMALREENRDWAFELPVHNVFLFLGADTGLVGVIAFFGLIAAALLRHWKVIVSTVEPERRLALAFAAGLFAYVLDGITDPLFRESIVYMMFWVTIAASVALLRAVRRSGAETA